MGLDVTNPRDVLFVVDFSRFSQNVQNATCYVIPLDGRIVFNNVSSHTHCIDEVLIISLITYIRT